MQDSEGCMCLQDSAGEERFPRDSMDEVILLHKEGSLAVRMQVVSLSLGVRKQAQDSFIY